MRRWEKHLYFFTQQEYGYLFLCPNHTTCIPLLPKPVTEQSSIQHVLLFTILLLFSSVTSRCHPVVMKWSEWMLYNFSSLPLVFFSSQSLATHFGIKEVHIQINSQGHKAVDKLIWRLQDQQVKATLTIHNMFNLLTYLYIISLYLCCFVLKGAICRQVRSNSER